jgi:antitoxin component of MazEF toxin-antitoxin module
MRIVGEVTTIAKASSNYASLRTVIPMSIVKQWNLKEGDKLDWSWEVHNNEMFVAVRRIGQTDRSHKLEGREKGKKKK